MTSAKGSLYPPHVSAFSGSNQKWTDLTFDQSGSSPPAHSIILLWAALLSHVVSSSARGHDVFPQAPFLDWRSLSSGLSGALSRFAVVGSSTATLSGIGAICIRDNSLLFLRNTETSLRSMAV